MEDLISIAERVRSPIVGGMFYPEDETETIDRLIAFDVEKKTGSRAAAIVAPHGAWDISGSIAGAAFSAAAGRYGSGKSGDISQVVILGTVHDKKEDGIFLSESDSFQTPLGNLPVDREFCDDLLSCNTLFELNDIPHLREHSIEVLLPFIKYYFPHVSIVPILMGNARQVLISTLARALEFVFEPVMEDTLLVVSCNLSMNNNEDLARIQAEECVRLLVGKKTAEFSAGVQNGRISACGGALAASLLESGLVDRLEASFASGGLIHAKGEENKTVYYGAISYE
ncbi:MAG: AmmeMemoRadiSam system protein B [Treponema sp.]|jgi:AmmeMemoRadiSam system protein B|nr:AmmeMemoRadiSam system protein B [Treponema sp.]